MLLNFWCWRRLLRVPWTAKRPNQWILKEINPEYSLEGLILKLTFQYFGHLMWRAYSLEKTLMLGKIEGRRRRGRQGMRWLDGIKDSMNMSLRKPQERRTGKPGVLQSMGSQRVGLDLATEQKQQDLTTRFWGSSSSISFPLPLPSKISIFLSQLTTCVWSRSCVSALTRPVLSLCSPLSWPISRANTPCTITLLKGADLTLLLNAFLRYVSFLTARLFGDVSGAPRVGSYG